MERMTDDGKPLTATSHPVAPWWYRAWVWAFRRNIRASALKNVEIEIVLRGTRKGVLNGGDQ